jgi:hypothetical protein
MTLNVPMTAVRSFGRITAATKAERGAESIDCVQARRIKKTRARGMFDGRGISASATLEGRCVNTIVCVKD